jgi:hypothetical protein
MGVVAHERAAELPDGADVALFGIGRADMTSPAFGEFNDSQKAGHAAHPACYAGCARRAANARMTMCRS